MKIVDVGPQGGAPWHAHRAEHWNASDAPAVMGCSPYKTRAQLMQELHTGVAADVDAGTERRFADGHRFEALARPLAEKIIGDDLYPCVGTEGKFSASFDGLTLGGEAVFEHKSLNDELRAVMGSSCTGAELPALYRIQMEHQLLVSGAERVLFMASKWNGDTLVEERHCWYRPNLALRDQVIAAWRQFERDLAAYVPPERSAPAAVAAPVETLPAVRVLMSGALTVTTNLDAFSTALRSFIDKIPAKPSTDQEFADTDAACKALKKAEEALEAEEERALAGMSDVEQMRRLVADLRNLARTTRLAREKMVEARKLEIRTEEVQRGKAALAQFVAALNDTIGRPLMPSVPADFALAIKGLRSLDSVRAAIDQMLANAKIEASAVQQRITANLRRLTVDNAEHAFLFPDVAALVQKEPDYLTAVITARIAEHQAKEAKRIEAETARIRADEQAKAQREAAAAAEAQARREREAAAATVTTGVLPATAALAAPMPGPAVVQLHRAAPSATTEPPSLNLGAINARLGFTMTAAFVTDTLGVQPAATDKQAKLFRESDFARICASLQTHISAMYEKHAA